MSAFAIGRTRFNEMTRLLPPLGVDGHRPAPGDRVPYFVGTGSLLDAPIQTLAYVIMAPGLNIVVGFAGLLDLGYVTPTSARSSIGCARPFSSSSTSVVARLSRDPVERSRDLLRSSLDGTQAGIPASTSTGSGEIIAEWHHRGAGIRRAGRRRRRRGDYLAIVTASPSARSCRASSRTARAACSGSARPTLQRPPGHHADRHDQLAPGPTT